MSCVETWRLFLEVPEKPEQNFKPYDYRAVLSHILGINRDSIPNKKFQACTPLCL